MNKIKYSNINNSSSNIYITNRIKNILPRNSNIWVDDSLITKCYNCENSFSIFKRKHHCRGCGKIFCYDCASLYIKGEISNNKLLDRYKYIYNNNYNNITENRVCLNCFNIFSRLKIIRKFIIIFQIIPITIIDIYKLSLVNKIWNESSLIYLSNFREIQYLLPTTYTNKIQRLILCNNFYQIIGHSNLLYQFIKLYNWDKLSNKNIDNILYYIKNNNKILCCNRLLCNTNCTNTFEHYQILDNIL